MATDSSRPHKTCPKCGESLPVTSEFFSRNKNRPDGLNVWCKNCLKAWRLANRELLLEKKRTYHHERKDNEDYKQKRRESNRRWRMAKKEHVTEYNRQYRRANLDQRREYNRRFREEHPDYQLTYLRRWREANPLKNREYTRKYYRQKPDYFRFHNHRWRQRNPEKVMIFGIRRRTRELEKPHDFDDTDWYWTLKYFRNGCAVCGRRADETLRIAADHWIPLSHPDCPGTIPTNIVPLCHGQSGCNNSKSDKMPDIWLIETYGQEMGQTILAIINNYFEWVKSQTE